MLRSIALLLLFLPLTSFAAGDPTLEASQFPAGPETADTLLRIAELGRYALLAQSPRGSAALQLVDRMAGTLAAGAGRLDLFLEPGEYRVRLRKQAADAVSLEVRSFEQANLGREGRAPELGEDQSAWTALRDFQSLSWWIEVQRADAPLLLMLEGRCLQEAVLWTDGAWDTGLRPLRRVRELQPGRPVTALEFHASMAPGRYLLTAVGGPRLAWAQDSGEDPLLVRRGARRLGEMGLLELDLGQSGEESFLVAGQANFFQLAAGNARGYRLELASSGPGVSRHDAVSRASFDEKSASFRCSLQVGAATASRWLTVSGPPGEHVQLRWFAAVGARAEPLFLLPYRARQSYLTTVLGAAEGQESVDLTGLLLEVRRKESQTLLEPLEIQALSVGPGQPLRRRINSLGTDTFLLRVLRSGSYALLESSRQTATALYRFSLLDDQLRRAGTPLEAAAGDRLELKEKLYSVSVVPKKAGPLDFAILPQAERSGTGAPFSSPAPSPANGLCWVGGAQVQERFLVLNNRYRVPFGVQLRELPASLGEPLCVRVPAKGALELPILLPAPARLISSHAGFSAARVDGQPWKPETVFSRGEHRLELANPGPEEAWHVIGPLPPLPAAAAGSAEDPRDRLPRLAEGSPDWRSFERGQTVSYLLRVQEPATYRLSTFGRLSMSLTMRTSLSPRLASAAGNVDGLNAALTAYLRPGEYLLVAQAQGASRGRAGILLQRMQTVSGGLAEGGVLRRTVPPGELLAAELTVEEPGNYALECLALGRSIAYRLEDAGGWPIGPPVASGPFSGFLAKGRYRYLSAAEPVATRRLLALRRAEAPVSYDPKARTVPLQLNRTYRKTWVEAPGRPEDVFPFECPAPLRVTLHLSEGLLFRLGPAGGEPLFQGGGGQPQELELAAGRHELRVRSALEDNMKEYQVALATADLADGIPQAAPLPAGTVPLSINKEQTVEIWSYGAQEAEGLLLDSSGRTVARGEPIADDWNFRIVASLPPGRYLLAVVSPLQAQLPPQKYSEQQPGRDSEEQYSEEDYSEEEYSEDEVYSEEQYSEEEYSEEQYSEEEAGLEQSPGLPVPELGPPPAGATVLRLVTRGQRALPPASGSLDQSVELAGEVASVVLRPTQGGLYRLEGGEGVWAGAGREGRELASGPGPLFLPLASGASYTVRFWQAEPRMRRLRLVARLEPHADAGPQEEELRIETACLRVVNPANLSFRVEAGEALLYSAGLERPARLLSPAAVNTAAGEGWLLAADGSALGRLRLRPLELSADGKVQPVLIGEVEQRFRVTVPPRTAALVQTDNAGGAIGLSLASSAQPGYGWQGSAVDPLASLAGLAEGSFQGRLWDAEGGAERLRDLSLRLFPIASEESLPRWSRRSFSVPARSAVVVRVEQGVQVSLEKGLAAFGWQAGPHGFLDGLQAAVTGCLHPAGNRLLLVNATARPALGSLGPAAVEELPALSEAQSYEAPAGRHPAGAKLSLASTAPRASRLYLWSAEPALEARFLSEEDGRIYRGDKPAGKELGGVLVFPGGRGRLEIAEARGPLRAWVSDPESWAKGFAAREPGAATTALPPEGGRLAAAPQAWTFSLEREAMACLSADDGGVTALYGRDGELLAAAAGAERRTLLRLLPRGTFTAFTRPWRSGGQSGTLRLRLLEPVALAQEGEGPPTLLGPGELALYRFEVKAAGRTGAGVRSDGEGLWAALYDGSFRPLAEGLLFLRELPPGPYYLLVGSRDATRRLAPVVYGLAGSRAEVPEQILRSYRSENQQ